MTKDGKILNIWLTASALTDENGQMVEMAITERDLDWLAGKAGRVEVGEIPNSK